MTDMAEDLEALIADSKFTAEISKRMRVPDRICMFGDGDDDVLTAVRGGSAAEDESPGGRWSRTAESSLRRGEAQSGGGVGYNGYTSTMQVPERILLAGNNTHIADKRGPPRELQLENTIIPPNDDDIRVSTPPRTIRLDGTAFTTTSSSESSPHKLSAPPPPPLRSESVWSAGVVGGCSGDAVENDLKRHSPAAAAAADANQLMTMGAAAAAGPPDNSTPWEEIQLLRRQMAKLNHRLMSVELESQQAQQREMLLTVFLSIYFVGKFIFWINRSPY